MTRTLAIALVLIAVAAAVIYSLIERSADDPDKESNPASAAYTPRPPVVGSDPTGSAPSPNAMPKGNVSVEPERYISANSFNGAMTTISPPPKPIREMLRAYRNNSSPTDTEKLELFAALSYCSNARPAAELARAMRAAGQGAAGGAVDALDKQHDAYVNYCSTVAASDYLLRSEILQEASAKGDKDAMLAFFDAGPAGTWYESDLQLLGEDKVAMWHAKASSLLLTATQGAKVSTQSAGALTALISLFQTPAAEDKGNGDPFAKQRDNTQAYAYALAYSELLRGVDGKRYEEYRRQTLVAIAKPVSTADQAAALQRAREILKNMGAKI